METETKWNRVISQKNTIDDHYPKKGRFKRSFLAHGHLSFGLAMAESELLEYESDISLSSDSDFNSSPKRVIRRLFASST